MADLVYSGKYSHYLATGQINLSSGTVFAILMQSADDFTFDPATHFLLSDVTHPVWQASATYAEDDIVTPTTPNGRKYQIATGNAGTSGTTEPTWPTTTDGTVVDGTCTWTDIGNDQQVPTANGYTQNSKALVQSAITNTLATGLTTIIYDNASWTATGGTLGLADNSAGTIGGIMLLYDADDPIIIGYAAFANGQIVGDEATLIVENILLTVDG